MAKPGVPSLVLRTKAAPMPEIWLNRGAAHGYLADYRVTLNRTSCQLSRKNICVLGKVASVHSIRHLEGPLE